MSAGERGFAGGAVCVVTPRPHITVTLLWPHAEGDGVGVMMDGGPTEVEV